MDELVAGEHNLLCHAAAVVFHMVAFRADGSRLENYASRFELGLLAGRRIPSYVFLDPELHGRNYLWAICKLYSHLHYCESLEQALENAAAAYLRIQAGL